VADGTGGEAHRRARHCHFAEIEGRSAAADAAADHDEAGFRATHRLHHRLFRQRIPRCQQFLCLGAGEQIDGAFTPVIRSRRSYRLLRCSHHLFLEMSIDIDNHTSYTYP